MILPDEISGIEFFQNLGESHRNQVALMARLEERTEGTVLFGEGEASSCIYFVLTGTISLEVVEPDGESVEVCTAGPGDLVGWSPVLGRPTMTATARALTRCRLAAIEAKQVLALCERDPRFGMAFLRAVALVLSERLQGTRRCLALARSVGSRSLLGAIP